MYKQSSVYLIGILESKDVAENEVDFAHQEIEQDVLLGSADRRNVKSWLCVFA